MHALGRTALPDDIKISGEQYRLAEFIKHDFTAATGFYDRVGDATRVVVKLSRTEPFLGLPLRFFGRMVCRRELRFYARLADLPNVPRIVGLIGDTGFAHAYVNGQPLSKQRPIPDGFFDQVSALLDTLHARGIAYADTNKPENILLGDDGRPHLIDFQISFDAAAWGYLWPARRVLKLLSHSDAYHVAKHKRRLRPDELTDADHGLLARASWSIRLHRLLFKPYFFIRRRMFKWLRRHNRLMPEGSK